MIRRPHALSLIEVVLAVTIAVVAISMGTIGLAGQLDDARVHAAAQTIANVLRQARAKAAAIGRPVVMRMRSTSCELLLPRLRENEWEWGRAGIHELPGSVSIAGISWFNLNETMHPETVMNYWVHPQTRTTMEVILRDRNNVRFATRLDPWSGHVEFANEGRVGARGAP